MNQKGTPLPKRWKMGKLKNKGAGCHWCAAHSQGRTDVTCVPRMLAAVLLLPGVEPADVPSPTSLVGFNIDIKDRELSAT